MRSFGKCLGLWFCARARCRCGAAAQQQSSSTDQVVDKIVTQEQAEMQMLRQYSPLVETYIQNLRPDQASWVGSRRRQVFPGQADLSKGVELDSLTTQDNSTGVKHKMLGGLGSVFTMQMEFLPRGFLQMIYLDTNGFDRAALQLRLRAPRISRRSSLPGV